jgi:hypothetical protein
MTGHDRGQASVEFVALLLLACLALGALLALSGGFDGRDAGGFLAHHFTCAVSRRCVAGERQLTAAYGARDAATVRALAPNLVYERGERELPVDWRGCRRVSCSLAPDDAGLDAHLAASRATAFTHVLRRGGRLYVQYWLYYPDSNTTVAGSDRVWARALGWIAQYPGFHRDDWEGAFVRVDRDGRTWRRASSHGHFQGCKWADCRNRWVRDTGWARVSRGSHAGHVPFRSEPRARRPHAPRVPRYIPAPPPPRRIPVWPGHGLHERSTTGEGMRLVPLEALDPGNYAPLDADVLPPWAKNAYLDPEAGES